ncbi:hypothetical protein C9I92_07130 [Photobacterium ganghwense]|uniref:Uncharacterized protein n=1 Tax=Photobacterium ganghwense TaxID=320778 RepID=A0A0J1HDX3_9GAMM|nr:hypothetical protein ABT57_09085 [Photobacterium ganghwense]PSU09331.1 hypothetical protein C9I92_07130 [Photobacterium ganghwense]
MIICPKLQTFMLGMRHRFTYYYSLYVRLPFKTKQLPTKSGNLLQYAGIQINGQRASILLKKHIVQQNPLLRKNLLRKTLVEQKPSSRKTIV